MAVRFVHTADLHLDSPLVSLALRDPALAEEVGTATRTALSRIVDLCLAEAVDALLIAGDLWDGAQGSAKTPRFLRQELARLGAAGIRSFLIRGNHDAMSKVTRELEPPPGTHVFGGRAATEVFEARGRTVAVHGLSFAQDSAPESLLPRYPAPVPGAINIGMMHTSLNGSPGHDNYAPCAVADLDAQGYDYWALGHIHRRAEYRGRSVVVMPGMPQGRDIGESGEKTVTLVTVADDGTVTTNARAVAPLRFERVELDLSGIADWAALPGRLASALRDAAAGAAGTALVLRPVLVGATPLAWRIGRDLDRLTEEARAAAEAIGGVWIDKLEARVSGGDVQAGRLPADLLRLLNDDLPRDAGLAAQLRKTAEELLHDLPPELRGLLGEDEAALDAACAALLATGTAQLLARLAPGGEEG